MKLATKYAPCLRGQGDDVGIIIFEKINFFGRMTRQGIEPATSRTRVRNDTSKPSPFGNSGVVTPLYIGAKGRWLRGIIPDSCARGCGFNSLRVILQKKCIFSKIIIPTSSPCPLQQGAYLVASFIGLIVYRGKVVAPAIRLPSILNPPIFSAAI